MGRGAEGQTLWGYKGSKEANVGGGELGKSLTEPFCSLKLGFEMD